MGKFKITGYSNIEKTFDILYKEENIVVESKPYINVTLILEKGLTKIIKNVKLNNEQELTILLQRGYYEY